METRVLLIFLASFLPVTHSKWEMFRFKKASTQKKSKSAFELDAVADLKNHLSSRTDIVGIKERLDSIESKLLELGRGIAGISPRIEGATDSINELVSIYENTLKERSRRSSESNSDRSFESNGRPSPGTNIPPAPPLPPFNPPGSNGVPRAPPPPALSPSLKISSANDIGFSAELELFIARKRSKDESGTNFNTIPAAPSVKLVRPPISAGVPPPPAPPLPALCKGILESSVSSGSPRCPPSTFLDSVQSDVKSSSPIQPLGMHEELERVLRLGGAQLKPAFPDPKQYIGMNEELERVLKKNGGPLKRPSSHRQTKAVNEPPKTPELTSELSKKLESRRIKNME